jgi:1,4-dihydroxy-2-naphthoyl-CoA hydrolase
LTEPPAAPPSAPGGPLPGFDGLYGLELLTTTGDEVRGRIRIDERHLQPFGIVHGGVYSAAAESMASMGTYVGTGGDKFVAGLSNVANFLRPVFAGDTVDAVAVPRHRGRTTWVWEVDLRDGQDRPCALVRVTIAVREAEGDRALPAR